MFWVNGVESDLVARTDRSFQYGDGCFTTILMRDGKPEFWQHHVERMDRSLNQLLIPSPNWTQVADWVRMAAMPESVAGIKIHISRGEGGRGYSPTQVYSPSVTISAFAFPDHYKVLRQQGMHLGVCRQRLGLNPMLAGLKHNNRLEQVVLKGEMDQQGLVDGVALDIEGYVVETTMANLFWRHADKWFTPALDFAGVAGVMRRNVLDQLRAEQQCVEQGRYPLSHLEQSDEIFMTNAILGIAPVVSLGEIHYTAGNQTRRLQEHFKSC